MNPNWDLRERVTLIVRQMNACPRHSKAKRFYMDLLLKYRTYDPVGTRGIA
jgi:hypothetical protein